MTVEYLDAKRIQGSSIGAKTPTYEAVPSAWDYDDAGTKLSYSGDGATSKVTFNVNANSINEWAFIDIGSAVSDSLWTMRFKITFTTISDQVSDANECQLSVGLWDSSAVSGEVPSGLDGLTFNLRNVSGTILTQLASYESGSWQQTNGTDEAQIGQSTTTAYVELARTSATAGTIKVFSDSSYSTQVGATITDSGISSNTGLEYLVVRIYTQTVGSTTIFEGTIEDIDIWNNSSATQDDKATLITPSSESDWTTDSEFTFSGGELQARAVPTSTIKKATYDTGLTLGTTWVIRFPYTPTSSANNCLPLFIANTESQISKNGNNGHAIGMSANGGAEATITSINGGTSTDGTWITGLSVDTTYYIELINDDTNLSIKIWENSDYTSQHGSTQTVSYPNWTDLDILQSTGRSDGGNTGTGGTNEWNIGAILIYNGQTSATTLTKSVQFTASSDLPENTIFNETDTYRQYWLQSGEWKRTDPVAKSCTLTNTSDFQLSDTTGGDTNDTVERLGTGSYDSSWAYQASSITATNYYEYYVNDVKVYTSGTFNSDTLYPSIACDLNAEGVKWQLVKYNANEVEWKIIGYSDEGTNEVYSTFCGVHNSTTKATWGQMQASFFIGSGSPNTLQVVERSGGSTNYVYTDLTHTMTIGDTFKIVVR